MKQTLKRLFSFPVNTIAIACLVAWIFGVAVHPSMAADDDDRRPSEHFCPITYEVMKDPVVAADGYSYEREAIETYFKGCGNARSPMTGLALSNKNLINNQALKTMINDWTPNLLAVPSALSGNADILAQRIREEFQRNAALLGSSKGQHIVAFLGNTGAGKSTLVNFLAGKKVVVSDDEEDYVLANPQDQTAMTIGRGGHSETIYPKFIDVNGLRFFDLPGFNDTDGSERNLMNAAFIRKILLDAASVRLVFVAGQDQFMADRSASVRQLFDSIRQLFVIDQGNMNLVDDGIFVATKVTSAPQAEITDFLLRRTDSKDKATLNRQLKLWSDRNQLGRMFHPLREAQNQGVREQILGLIQGAKSARVWGINVSALYPPDTKEPLERMFFSVLEGAFNHKLDAALETLSDYDEAIASYGSGTFWSTFEATVRAQEDAMELLKEFCVNPYNKALKRLEKENEGKRQKHIQGLRNRREKRIEDIERRTEARTWEVITSFVPQGKRDDFVAFDFAWHRDYYDRVCAADSIKKLAADQKEQEVVRRYYAEFISRHSHGQMMRWHEKFSGIYALALAQQDTQKDIEDLKKQLEATQKELQVLQRKTHEAEMLEIKAEQERVERQEVKQKAKQEKIALWDAGIDQMVLYIKLLTECNTKHKELLDKVNEINSFLNIPPCKNGDAFFDEADITCINEPLKSLRSITESAIPIFASGAPRHWVESRGTYQSYVTTAINKLKSEMMIVLKKKMADYRLLQGIQHPHWDEFLKIG
jgi:predicted GTPase